MHPAIARVDATLLKPEALKDIAGRGDKKGKHKNDRTEESKEHPASELEVEEVVEDDRPPHLIDICI